MKATLAFRLLMSFFVVTLLTITVGVTGVITLRAAATRAERSYDHATQSIVQAEAMESPFFRTRLAVYRALAVRTDEVRKTLVNDLAVLADEWNRAALRYGATLESDAERERFAVYEAARKEYAAVIAAVGPQVAAGLDQEALAYIAAKGFNAGQILMATIGTVVADASQKAEGLAKETQDVSVQVTWYLIFLTLLGTVVGIVAGWGITRWVTRSVGGEPAAIAEVAETIAKGVLAVQWTASKHPATGIRASMEKMTNTLAERSRLISGLAQGDLTQAVVAVSSEDALAESLSHLTASLQETLGTIRHLADQTLSEARQVSAASQALSQSTVEQSAALEEIGSSLSEVTGHCRQYSQHADNASLLAGIVQQTAQDGKDHVDELVAGMGVVRTSGDAVETIAKAIDDIAFQINLLALNANIEAARAGSAGRGFAVVAEEVRNLARRSSEAAREASERISKSREEIGSMDTLVRATSDRWITALEGTQKLAAQVEEISKQTQTQAAALKQIEAALGQIDQSTQANAASAEQTAAAAEQLNVQAEEVQRKISFFRLLDEAAVPGYNG